MRATRTSPRLPPATRRHAWRRVLRIGLPVGLLQVAINQGDGWLRHQVDAGVVCKSVLSPLVSCAIAWFSALSPVHDPENRLSPGMSNNEKTI